MNQKKPKDRKVCPVQINLTEAQAKKLKNLANKWHVMPSSLAAQWVGLQLDKEF